ncbi:hypothetical protein XENOCAPTIV_026164 [Xenoophorus captivus]|uniref:Uncharacterized protein n=1 Tax=Xenoophorus captivus TaxID=1517983 RepID=A0ABV0S189_9TELE
MHQLPLDIISMIMVVRKVMNLSSNQLMSIIDVITQISHKLSLLYLSPNEHKSNKILAIPIISIRTDHLPFNYIVTLKWNVLSSGTESKQFFSKKTNHKQNSKMLLPLPSGFCASSCPVTSLVQVGGRRKLFQKYV